MEPKVNSPNISKGIHESNSSNKKYGYIQNNLSSTGERPSLNSDNKYYNYNQGKGVNESDIQNKSPVINGTTKLKANHNILRVSLDQGLEKTGPRFKNPLRQSHEVNTGLSYFAAS